MQQSAQFTLEGQPSSLDQSQEMSLVCWQPSHVRSFAAASWNGYPLKIDITVFATDGMESVHLACSLHIPNFKFFVFSISFLVVEGEGTPSLMETPAPPQTFPSSCLSLFPEEQHPGFPREPEHLCVIANKCWRSKDFLALSLKWICWICILCLLMFVN